MPTPIRLRLAGATALAAALCLAPMAAYAQHGHGGFHGGGGHFHGGGRGGYHGYRGGYHGGGGGGGLLLGLGVGALVGGAIVSQGYAPPPAAYYPPPPPAYYAPPPGAYYPY